MSHTELIELYGPAVITTICKWIMRTLDTPFNWTGLTLPDMVNADMMSPALARQKLYESVICMDAHEMVVAFGEGKVPGIPGDGNDFHGIDVDQVTKFYEALGECIKVIPSLADKPAS